MLIGDKKRLDRMMALVEKINVNMAKNVKGKLMTTIKNGWKSGLGFHRIESDRLHGWLNKNIGVYSNFCIFDINNQFIVYFNWNDEKWYVK